MRINTNVASIQAQESLTNTNKNINSSLEKLSTGLRINKASDDASGLAIADKLRTQASGLDQAVSNGNSAVTMTQIADKAMAEESNILDTVKQKLIQASTATTSEEGVKAIGKDITKLLDQINNIASQTSYNGTSLLQASAAGTGTSTTKTFQMGTTSSDTISLASGVQANTSGLGVSDLKASASNGFSAATAASSQDKARKYLSVVDDALTKLNSWRADVGSTQNQVESSVRNMMTQATNTKAAESVIRDVDYAKESAEFNKQNIISQAGTYALSQANATSQSVMRLLQ
jgi:flagellin